MTVIIEYKNGEQIIIHPTGIVSIYKEDDLKRHRDFVQRQLDRLNADLININLEISDIQNS